MKTALDIDWSDAEEKQYALNLLVRQLDRLAAWVARHVSRAEEAPRRRYVEALGQVKVQALKSVDGGGVRLRHGRKSVKVAGGCTGAEEGR